MMLDSTEWEKREAGLKVFDELDLFGVSNSSFGLNPAARQMLNSVFLHEAMPVGYRAIVSVRKILPGAKIDLEQQEVCRDLIGDRRRFEGDVCVYDPLAKVTEFFQPF